MLRKGHDWTVNKPLSTASCSTPPAVSTKVADAAFYSESDIAWFWRVRMHPGEACVMPDSVWGTTVVIANRMLKLDAANARREGRRP